MHKYFRLLLLPCLFSSAFALADREVEIEFRHQPDGTGLSTLNQGIAVEQDEDEIEGEVWLNGEERETEISAVEAENLYSLVEYIMRQFEYIEGLDIDAPYTEVSVEFSGEDREIEITRRYAEGEMPEFLILLQEQYLDAVWQ